MTLKKLTAVLSAGLMAAQGLVMSAGAYEEKTGRCTIDYLNIRADAGSGSSWVGYLELGDRVTVSAEKRDSEGGLWYYIDYEGIKGYVASSYIETSAGQSSSGTAAADDGDFESYMESQGFPESYKPYLRQLHQAHPSWIFRAQDVGLDWNAVLKEEMVIGRNLVNGGAPASWKSMEKGAYNFEEGYWYGLDGDWVAASEGIVKYYLDPRNFLTEKHIFMFESLSYDPEVHNIDGVRRILSDSFMSGNYTCPDTGSVMSYAQTFMDAAAQSGVSPYHLASRCRNEQGVYGAPQSLGTVPGWENLFNFFDVQAFATASMTAAEMGCKYASTTNERYLLPWTNQYRSIVGGSIFLGNGYINKDQDTLYLQKYDVVDGGNGLYYHQYMTCVFGQANEAANMKSAYSPEILASAMEFKIPVYKNMPAEPCVKPGSEGDNNNYLASLSLSAGKLNTSFDKYRQSYTAQVGAEVTELTVSAAALNSNTVVAGTGKVKLQDGLNTVQVTVIAESGARRTYTVEITKAAGTVRKALPGDTDGDGGVTMIDALLILRHNAGKITLEGDQLSRADHNGDGKVDVVDALEILNGLSQ